MIEFFCDELSGGNRRVSIQADIYREVAVQKTGQSISRNDNQVGGVKPDETLRNAG